MTRHHHPSASLVPLAPSHAPRLAEIAADVRVAAPAALPWPLPANWASEFCSWRARASTEAKAVTRAVLVDQFVIGCVGLHHIDRQQGCAELAVWLAAEYWGLGFGEWAVKGLLEASFEPLELGSVRARYLAGNLRAARLLRRIGFIPETGSIEREGSAQRDTAVVVQLTRAASTLGASMRSERKLVPDPNDC